MITIIFFLALSQCGTALCERKIYMVDAGLERSWSGAGNGLRWHMTIYSGLGFTWRNRELIAPDQ
jgi:hypothetical protein